MRKGIQAADLTPADGDELIIEASRELDEAEELLEEARAAEDDAAEVHMKARTRLLLRDDCPRLGKGGVSAAERDAWLEHRLEEERVALTAAVTNRKNAESHVRKVERDSSLAQTLNSSIREAFGLGTGRGSR